MAASRGGWPCMLVTFHPSQAEDPRDTWQWSYSNARGGDWDNPMNHRTRFCSAADRILGQRGEVDRACRPYPDPFNRAREIAERLVAVAGERVSDETIVRTVAMRAGVSLSDARYAVEIEGSVR